MRDPHFDGVIFQTHAEELQRRMAFEWPPHVVLDVRGGNGAAAIPGAHRLPAAELEALPEGTTIDTEFIVYGEDLDDPSTRTAALKLMELGVHRVVELSGGLREWRDAGYKAAGE